MGEILFVGPIANTGGPAIKNKILVEQMQQCVDISVWNTYDKTVKSRVGAVIKILFTQNKYVIIAVSRKGRNLLYPIMLLKNKFCKTHFSCIAIGGKVEDSFNNNLSVRALYKADLVTVETMGLLEKMEKKYHLKNLYCMPNYKKMNVDRSDNSLEKYESKHIKFIFLSSMRNLKGVKTLIDAFTIVKKEGYDIQLDFYGPIKSDFDIKYLEEIENSDGMNYCGVVQNSEVLKVMQEYHIFVFPTEYPGEGFPAVLVEAMAVGMPIITSDVNYNPEIIKDNVNGFLFSKGNISELSEKMIYCCNHMEEMKSISMNNMDYAQQYDSNKVIYAYCNELKEKGWPI